MNEEVSRMNYQTKAIKPEYVFLVLSLLFGLLFSFVQPLFFEPDSSFHFDSSMYISDTVVDRESVGFSGEDFQSTPISFTKIVDMERDGTYEKNFFKTKLPLIHKKNADSRISGGYGTDDDLQWWNDIMHVIPALGVKLGYMFQPTIGSMVITARVLSVLFFSISLFIVIKLLKAYHYVFVIVSLTPTVIQSAASLSYDCYNYVACTVAIMIIINFGVDIKSGKTISPKKFVVRSLLPTTLLFFAKTNSKLLLLGIAAIGIYLLFQKININLTSKNLMAGLLVMFMLVMIGTLFFYSEQLVYLTKRIFYTLIEPYYTVITTEVISGTTTAAVPYWFYGIQIAVISLLFLSYPEEVVPKWISLGSLLLVIMNFMAIMASYGFDSAFLDSSKRVIIGPQGRYFTPFILLLAPCMTRVAKKITVIRGRWLTNIVITVSICALVLNLAVTSIKFYHLHLPADEYRSGVDHYIFK